MMWFALFVFTNEEGGDANVRKRLHIIYNWSSIKDLLKFLISRYILKIIYL